MKLGIIILVCCCAIGAFSQQRNPDSLRYFSEQRQIFQRSSQKVDSIGQSFYQQSDSLEHLYKSKFVKMDSAQTKLQSNLSRVRSLQTSIENAPQNRIDSIQSFLQTKIDSSSLNLQAAKIRNALDSVKSSRDSTMINLDKKIQAVKDNTIGKLNSLDLPPEVKSKISTVTESIEGYKIPASDLGLSAISPNSNLSLPGMDNLNLPSTTPSLPGTGGLESIKGGTGALPDIAGKTCSYGNEVKQLGSSNIGEVKNLPSAAESKAGDLSGMNEVKGQTKALDEYKGMAGSMQNPDSLKGFVKEEVKKVAVNHFAGKEKVLQQAMETMSKYKNKYSSLNSLADAKKRRPNEMKGKPFIERLIPGIAMQIEKKGDDFMVDFNPYAGYRFTGRITAGAGWNQRVAYNLDKKLFNPDARVFGPRVYGEFKLWKGFSPRIEGEVMNTKIPPSTVVPSTDPAHREWVWGAFVGLKKEYRFFKNVKGTAMVMTRLFNPDRKSPYADVLNVRFGFEFPMKKKVK